MRRNRPDAEPVVPREPALPHERDESTGATGNVPDARAKKGLADVKRGVVDTSRAPEADRAYEKLKKK